MKKFENDGKLIKLIENSFKITVKIFKIAEKRLKSTEK